MKIRTLTFPLVFLLLLSAQACATDSPRDGHPGMGYEGGHGDMMGHHGTGKGEGHHGDYGGHRGHRGHKGGHSMKDANLMRLAKFHGIYRLNLTDEQRAKFKAIQRKLKKDLWQLMGKMLDVQAAMEDVWQMEKPDPAKVGAVYKDMFDLQRQGIEARVAAKNKIYDFLTAEQRERFRRSGHRGYGKGDGHHRGHHDGGRHHMMD